VGNLSNEPQYVIEVRQQLVAALYSIEGNHERDPRTIINPLPIIQLLVKGSTVVPSNFRDYYQGLAVRCFLRGENAFLTNQNEQVTDTDRLLGTVIRSPVIGWDEDGSEGSFFCFSDLSCTTPGNYRLYFELILSDMKKPSIMRTPDDVRKSGIIAWTLSDVFVIYTAEEFPGGGPMTALTKALKRQGCITVENSNESKDKGNPVKFRLEKSLQPQSGGGETQKTLPKNISNATGRPRIVPKLIA